MQVDDVGQCRANSLRGKQDWYLYFSPVAIRATKPQKMRWTGDEEMSQIH
jgi:hypothetical protein